MQKVLLLSICFFVALFSSNAQSKTYNYSILNKELVAVGIKETSTGNFYLVSNSERNLIISYTKSLDSTFLWTKSYKDFYAFDLILNEEDDLILVGQTFKDEAASLKINKNNGDVSFRITKPNVLRYIGVIQNQKKEYVFSGYTSLTGNHLFLDIVDSNGAYVQNNTYDIGHRTVASGLCQLKNGNYVISGGLLNQNKWNPMLIKITPRGTSVKAYDIKYTMNNKVVNSGRFDNLLQLNNSNEIIAQYSIRNSLSLYTTTYGLLKMNLSDTLFEVLDSVHFMASNTYLKSDEMSLDSSNTRLILGGYIHNQSTIHSIDLTTFKSLGIYAIGNTFSNYSGKVSYAKNNDILFMATDSNLTDYYHLKIGKLGRLKWQNCIEEVTIKDTFIRIANAESYVITSIPSTKLRLEPQTPTMEQVTFKQVCFEEDKTSITAVAAKNTYIFPNPVLDNLFLNLPSSMINRKFSYQIRSINGQVIIQNTVLLTNEKFSINTSNLQAGLYILNVTNDSKTIPYKFSKK